MDVNLERFHQTFFDESVEHLASMEAALLELEGRPDDDERLNAIFRGAHSIKGASGTFGFTDVAQFTHTLESLLDRLRHHQIVASAGLVDLLLRATDMLRLLIAAARQGGNAPAEAGTLQRELTQALGEEAAAGAQRPKESVPPSSQAPSQRDYDVTFVPNTDLLRLGADPLLVLRALQDVGEVQRVQADLSHLPDLESMDPESCYLAWAVRLRSDQTPEEIADVFNFVQDHAQVAVTAAADDRSNLPHRDPGPEGLRLYAELLGARAAFQQQLAEFASKALPGLLSALGSP